MGIGASGIGAYHGEEGFKALSHATTIALPRFARVGHIDEWHLDRTKAFRHIPFNIASRLSQEGIVFGSPLS